MVLAPVFTAGGKVAMTPLRSMVAERSGLRVGHGHEKVPTGGQVEVPGFGALQT